LDKGYSYPAAGGAAARLEARGYAYDPEKDVWFIPGILTPEFKGNIVRDNLRIVHEVLDRYDEEKGTNKSVHLKRLEGRYLHDAALLAAIMLEKEKKINNDVKTS